MCLTYNKELTKTYKKKTEPFIAYKLVRIVINNRIVSPYRQEEIFLGINKSNRKSTTVSKKQKQEGIEKGCHLFLTRKDAVIDKNDCLSRYQYQPHLYQFGILKVQVDPKKIIAAGYYTYVANNSSTKRSLLSLSCTEYTVLSNKYMVKTSPSEEKNILSE